MDQYSPEEIRQAQAMQQEMMMYQQQEVFQNALLKLTVSCYDKCITTPSAKLTSGETTCIKSCGGRFLDTTQFLVKKLQHSQMQ